jgi:DNA sulfur modification protein DndC
MATGNISEIKDSLRELYVADSRPWLVGFSGGKDSTLVASLIFDTVQSIPAERRKKEIAIVCTDTRVEIPAIVEMIETSLGKMRKCSAEQNLNIEVHLLRPPPEQSFWVNIIGRGYPPPNRTFRWCTQRMKINPVTRFVEQRMGRWSEAILHLGARRAESATRAQNFGRTRDTQWPHTPSRLAARLGFKSHSVSYHGRSLGLLAPIRSGMGRIESRPLQALQRRRRRRMSHPD